MKSNKPTYRNTKMWLTTLKKLRHIHAETGESMVKILDRLVSEEWQRLKNDSSAQNKVES